MCSSAASRQGASSPFRRTPGPLPHRRGPRCKGQEKGRPRPVPRGMALAKMGARSRMAGPTRAARLTQEERVSGPRLGRSLSGSIDRHARGASRPADERRGRVLQRKADRDSGTEREGSRSWSPHVEGVSRGDSTGGAVVGGAVRALEGWVLRSARALSSSLLGAPASSGSSLGLLRRRRWWTVGLDRASFTAGKHDRASRQGVGPRESGDNGVRGASLPWSA